MFVESTVRPLAIGTKVPRFSWRLRLEGRSRAQSAYRIIVGTDPRNLAAGEADMWDSGRVESGQSTHVPYAGQPLQRNADYYWTVELWDEQGEPVGDMGIESFGTALYEADEWQADWIGMGDANEPQPDPSVYQHDCVPPEVQTFEPDSRAPMFSRGFELGKPVKRARVFVSGLGLFELRLNGQKVGDDVLPTPRTDFRKRVLYQTYDVTEQLRQGENVLGLMLGNGWFNGQKSYWGWQMQWFGSPRAILQMEIELADGSTHRIVSDGSWQGTWSPITLNCLFDGETYDARLEQAGWDAPGFDRSGWEPVNVVRSPGGVLKPATCEPELITEILKPVGMVEPEPGVYVFDLGKNITGWVKLRVRKAEPGTEVKLHFGEAMHADGRLNASSNNRAKQTDRYIAKGGDEECWEPRFVFHGFQFVEVSGITGQVDLETVEGRFVRTAVAQTGHFACGSELINNIHRCTVQSLKCNVQMGVPTDDTQRPERQGWGADAWACANAAFYNLSMERLYTKWLADFRDQQTDSGFVGMITPQGGPDEDLVWSSAYPLIAWWQYLYTGDRRILEENYASLQRYMDFLKRCGQRQIEAEPTDVILSKLYQKAGDEKRFPAQADRGHLQFSQWGDHLSTAQGWHGRTNLPLSIATAFYYLDIATMTRIAQALGEDEDAGDYRTLAGEISTAFHERFFDEVLGQYDTGSQAAQAWPLAFGMVPDDKVELVKNYFVGQIDGRQRRLTTGYASTRFAIEALARMGRDDVIWKLATATTYPSWGYMLRLNRTTSCERWDGEGGSLNHAPLGSAIDEWLFSGLGGIRPDPAAPGYERIIFKPYLPSDLPWAQASVQTLRGTIRSAWKHEDKTATLDIEVPANSTGIVHVPCSKTDQIHEQNASAADADGVLRIEGGERETIIEVGSGAYHFEFPMS